jgi:hypothetical protein
MADIRVRVGQENAVKVISSLSSAGGRAVISDNVIGGIASVTQLSVSGISTFNTSIFAGISTFSNRLYIRGGLYFTQYSAYGIAYYGTDGQLSFTSSSAINISNKILTTDEFGVPIWSNIIDGGSY